jgi:ferredoxin-nitrate reductase
MQQRQFAQVSAGRIVDAWVPSTCGLCSIGCRVEIGVSEGEIVGVRGRPDHPVNAGRLGPKGLNQYYANHHPSRARYPFVRTANGRRERVSWDEALSLITQRIAETLATEGPDGIGIYNSGQLLLEEYYTLGKIARAGLGIATIDANTRLCTATTGYSLIESFGADGPPGAFEDFDQTDCILLVGHNAAEQSTVLWMRILAAKEGARKPKIIVVDPRRTATVSTGADLHLRLAPGTNVPLLNGLCHLLIHNGWIDRDFIARHTTGFEAFRDTVARYTPEVVQRLTGVPQADLRTAAEWIGRSERTVSTCLQGVYQSHQATAAACTVNSMHLLMGKIGRPGSAPLQFAGQPSSMNTRETGADGAYPAYRNWENPQHMADLARLWRIRPEMLGKKPVAAPEIFEMCENGQMKVLWNIGTNPAVSMTDRTKQLRTLNGVFLIVQDPFDTTATAQLADVFLPTAMWGEKTGCMTNAERRCTLVERAVAPPAEARPDFDIFVEMSRRLNLRDTSGAPLVDYDTPEGAFDEWREVSRGCIPDYSGMSYDKLRASGGLQWPCNDRNPAGTPRLYADWRFPTFTNQTETFEKDLGTGHEYTMRNYRDRHDPEGRAVLLASDYQPGPEAPDAEYPMTAISGRVAYHWHTRTKTNKAAFLHDAAPSMFVAVNVEDAARLAIADGDIVRVRSRRGSLTGPVRTGDVVPPGVVFIPFHYGDIGEDSAANALTSKLEDPASKQPVQKLVAVRLEAVVRT